MNSIFHRVSIRKFQDKPVEPEKIETLLRAAMAAPSARNQQPWEFYVVTNKDLIQKLSTVSPYAGCAKDAPVLIVSAYREDAISPAYAQIDLSIANENIWLEADALSLGGVWLGIAPCRGTNESRQGSAPTPRRASRLCHLCPRLSGRE